MNDTLRLFWLAQRASQWAYVSRLIAEPSMSGLEKDIKHLLHVHMYGAHMCALSLHHLNRCLEYLGQSLTRDPELLDAVKVFRTAYGKEKIDELRRALEHEEEAVSGKKLKRGRKKYEGTYPDPLVTGHHGQEGPLYVIRVLETDYVMEETLKAARELIKPLEDLTSRLAQAE